MVVGLHQTEEGGDGGFLDASFFAEEIKQLAEDSSRLHAHHHDSDEDSYIDEGAEDEKTFCHKFHQASAPSTGEFMPQQPVNWRDKRGVPATRIGFGKNLAMKTSFLHGAEPEFARFPVSDWRATKVAANYLKFCPGERCRVWLPLYHFAGNCNMEDGLDIYCIECNDRRRDERRKKAVVGVQLVEGGQTLSPDKYERFCFTYQSRNPPPAETEEAAVMRQVNERIAVAVEEAARDLKRNIPVDPVEMARRLFMRRRFLCSVTHTFLTPACFLDHHSLAFGLKQKGGHEVLEVVCSDCHDHTPVPGHSNESKK